MTADSRLSLRRPTEKDEEQVLAYRQAFLERGDSLDGTAGLCAAATYGGWLSALRDNESPDTVRPGLVDATTFLAVSGANGHLVGMIDIRHRLNAYLEQFGGHIGYSVLPSERRKGYAAEMLRLALEWCRDYGMEQVLVTCDSENTASERTILSNGGVLENKVPEGEGRTCRYWISLQERGSFEMNYKIALIKGDGIGPEVVNEAVNVLEAVGRKFGHTFEYVDVLLGGCATDAVGKSYPDGTAEKCRACDAVLLGAVGGPKWGSDKPSEQRPETALLAIRKDLGLYANLRPAALRPAMVDACPLKKETAEKGIDLMMVRELTGGVYFGKRDRYDTPDRGVECTDLMAYSELEIERIGRRAFELARLRRKKVSSVDKANVLETSRLWRSVMHRLAEEYPDVDYEDVLVDNCAMQLVRAPGQFDVVVTENMFGDILSDEASMVTGSIGLLPSASVGDTAPGLYEPIHGSAPDIAGQDKANPIATILSVAMMLRYSFQLPAEADAVEHAVDAVLAEGWRTADIAKADAVPVGTRKMGELIRGKI